jgi:CheY-like chemotaxis protein
LDRVLEGLRILIVEDELLPALELEHMVEDLGGKVVGPAPRLHDARQLAQSESLDGAILDMNLCGETTLPFLEELLARGIPVVLATGYGADILPEHLADTPLLPKPYDEIALQEVAERHLGRP